MNSTENNKKTELSPTKQRTPRQLPGQKNVGIYFAQSKRTIAMASVCTDSASSDEDEESDESQIAQDRSLRKRKRISSDPMTRKIRKIRKNFDGNITFVDEENKEFLEAEKFPEKLPSEKVLQNSLSSNIELTIKNKSATDNSSKDKESNSETQGTDTLEGLDDLFDEEWTYKKDTLEELNGFFEEEFSYKETVVDFTIPKRCIIIDIIWEKTDITLTVKEEYNEASTIVKCFGIWRYTKIEPGEFIVVMAKKETPDSTYWIVDNNFGYIINQPDILISGTSVVNSLFCSRQSLLQEKFRQIENLPYNNINNSYMLVGSLSHELLQTVLERGITEIKGITEILDNLLKSKHAIMMMYSGGVSMPDCKNLMRPAVVQIYKFIQRYIKGVVPDLKDDNYAGKIEKICDIEENVWIPELGIKGKIDLTVEVINQIKTKSCPTIERRVLPLELKTGKASFSSEHHGQLILYIMMMKNTGRNTDSGLLLYLRENIMKEIKGSIHAQRDLIALRNSVAYYSTRQPVVVKIKEEETVMPMEFPKPINRRSCSTCPYNTLCCTYLSDEDKKELHEGHHLKELYNNITGHLKPEHREYVMKWVSLLQLEETAERQDQVSWRDIWTLKPSKREKRGSCISHLNLVAVLEKSNRFYHEFQRSKESDLKVPKEINAVDFAEDEYVIVSTSNRINIIAGYIDIITSTSVFVHCDKNIKKVYNDTIFHIDKSSYSNFLMHNMSQLGGLLDNYEICSNLRKIVIEKQPATFTSELPPSTGKIAGEIIGKLNKDQRKSVLKTLTTDNYILIKGFPGTGKTQTLVAMIELFVKLDKSVLVTAHTNIALDNILLKLLDRKVDFIRLGSSIRAHPALVKMVDDVLTADCQSPEALHTLYSSKKVVGVTCYGATHPHLAKRKFDFCIVDESTQVLQPTILRPLYCADKFVLVGDPEQLPPIAKSNIARKLGINESLFLRLDCENNTIALTLQYRMNSCIMNVANKLTYHDQLQVGNEEIEKAILPISNVTNLENCEKWIRKSLSLRLKNSVILLNTSPTYHRSLDPSLQIIKGNSNYWEAAVIVKLIKVIKSLGIEARDIGVIAPYRAQVRLLRSILSSDIEINTVDQYQGRDKSIIIYSCTKSIPKDTNVQEFDILEDQQRLTVAVTRAKHKLIIVGDLCTLERFKPFSKLIAVLKSENQIYDLKEGEDDFYFDDLIQLLL
ncbi:DNA replication ATP-dependent helicase/nuclease DNA2-like [Phymastichus coffea]|uniref:DNA replication ATP-dependent helicase/nuclease DNA2-like n=1 Tax=Phymastichus coffea TaxID=108790 RepID=UPI00273C1294|nr:DNA replication ATP-dependent helicase/nuclease DNA2-like [Phymastichus coffea]